MGENSAVTKGLSQWLVSWQGREEGGQACVLLLSPRDGVCKYSTGSGTNNRYL